MLNKILKTLKNDKGSAYIDSAIKLIIAIILAAILLFGFFAILKSGVLPGIQAHIDGNMNGGQVQAMTDVGKVYAKWKNEFVDDIRGNKEYYEQLDEVAIIYAVANGIITYEESTEMSPDEIRNVVYQATGKNVEIPDGEEGIVIYWLYASLKHESDGSATVMTKEEFEAFERTDEGKTEIMNFIGS